MDDDFEPTAFEQDPDSDEFGEGYFTRRNGERIYGFEPEIARKLQDQGKASLQSTAPPPEPAMSEVLKSTPTDPEVQQLQREAPKATSAAPAAPRGGGMALASRTTQTGETGTNSSTTQTTRSAMPQEEFDRQQQQTRDTYDQANERDRVSGQQLSQGHTERAAAIRAAGQEREAAVAAAMAQQEQRKQNVAKRITEIDQRPIDQRKIWKDKGLLGSIGALAGIYMNTYVTTMLGTENTIAAEFDRAKAQNIKDQIEDKDSELNRLAKEMGSLDAAMPMFEARMESAIIERTKALAADEKSDEAIAKMNELISARELQKQKHLMETATAFYGNEARTQAASSTSSRETSEVRKPQATGGGSAAMEKALKLRKMMEENGYSREETDDAMRKMGFAAPGGESEAEFERRTKAATAAGGKRNEQEAKAESALAAADALGPKAGLVRDESGKWVVSNKGLVPPAMLERMNPFSDGAIGAAYEQYKESYGRFRSGGVIGPDEDPTFTEQTGGNTLTRAQLAAKMNAAEVSLREGATEATRNKDRAPPAAWKGQ